MCGICGLVKTSGIRDGDLLTLRSMNSALTHRGPDSEGYYSGGRLGMAMRRLSIIDLETGDQPLFSEDGNLVMVANGEIYNYIELREELAGKGHTFKSGSDSEVIIHMYEEYGVSSFSRLRGMFAFALYNISTGELLLVRDRFGEKPLYYGVVGEKGGGTFVFSSEIKSLLKGHGAEGSAPELDLNSINAYLHLQFVPEPDTCIEGVKKLPPGCYLKVEAEPEGPAPHEDSPESSGDGPPHFSITPYWTFEDIPPLEVPGDGGVGAVRDAFDDLSEKIIRADVPVGLSLSGGIDSSLIAVYSNRHSKEPLHAFSVGYPGRPECDERREAESLASGLKLPFHEIELTEERITETFPDLVCQMDDPVADIAAFGFYSVSKLASGKGVPVLLNGLGGDELFWGYEWVRTSVEKNLVKGRGDREEIKREAARGARSRLIRRDMVLNPLGSICKYFNDKKLEEGRLLGPKGRYILFDDQEYFTRLFEYKERLCTASFMRGTDDSTLYSSFTDSDWEDIPAKVSELISRTWLTSNSVTLGERLSMAASVEGRLPFLDHRLVDLVIGLRKGGLKDYKGGYKSLLIEAMDGIIPGKVLRRRKRGFTPPVRAWVRSIVDTYGELCVGGRLVERGILDGGGIGDFFGGGIKNIYDYYLAYRLVLLELWVRGVLEGEERGQQSS